MALNAIWARRCVTGTLALGLLSTSAGAATPEEGRRAYDAGHFSDAMGIWADLSRQGSAEAQFGLGLLYDLGNGTQRNPETAFFWYQHAADAGLPQAEFNVGAMYDSGRGVAHSSETAALWYAKAAARGHPRAQFDLGLLYQQGEGVPRNPDAAASWFRKAADGGITAAAIRLKGMANAGPDSSKGSLTGVIPVSPGRDATITSKDADATVELVWIAPPEPRTVRYEVQVFEVGTAALRSVLTASIAETATVVRLPGTNGFYAWTVDTVAQDGSHALGDWNWFTIETVLPSEQSMAAVPEKTRH